MKKLRKVPDSDIKHEGAALHAEAKVYQGLEGQGGDMGLAPLTLLCVQVLLILDPPVIEQILLGSMLCATLHYWLEIRRYHPST